MPRSQLVAEHLPLLRRYARALTGNQASGDAYVGAMLEALLQDQSLLDERHRAPCRAVPAVHPDLELGRAQRRPRGGDAADAPRTPAVEHHALAAPGLPAALAGGVFGGGGRVHSRQRRGRDPQARRRRRPGDGRRNRHRRADHRGRDLHRDGSRKPRAQSRPPRDRRRPHPYRRGSARQEQEAGPDSRPTSSSPTAPRASRPSTNCCGPSRFRWSSLPPIPNAS